MSQVILYQSEDGRTKLDVRLENQTVWLSQKQLTELFGKAMVTSWAWANAFRPPLGCEKCG